MTAAGNGGPVGRGAAFALLAAAGVLATAVLAPAGPAWAAARRAALVIGNGAYAAAAALPNPANDARDLGKVLREAGFEVAVHLDLDKAGMDTALRRFAKASRGAEAVLFFYAGHGLGVGDKNYLVPVDARLESVGDLDFEAVKLDDVTRLLEGEARTSLVFLDACRDNPLTQRAKADGGGRGASRSTRGAAARSGLTEMVAGDGTLIAYATAPGAVAEDGEGRNSPFAEALLRHLPTPGLEIRQMMTKVRADVRAATGNRQKPWDSSSLNDAFYFHAPAAPAAVAASPAPPAAAGRSAAADRADPLFWRGIEDSRRAADFEAYLEVHPQGVFAEKARRRLGELAAPGAGAAVVAGAAGPPPGTVTRAGAAPGEGSGEAGGDGEFEVYEFEE